MIEENIVSWGNIAVDHVQGSPSFHKHCKVNLLNHCGRHGSLDRRCIGDVSSLLCLENYDDNVFHPSVSTRLIPQYLF